MCNLASYVILELQFTGSALKPIALSLLTAWSHLLSYGRVLEMIS